MTDCDYLRQTVESPVSQYCLNTMNLGAEADDQLDQGPVHTATALIRRSGWSLGTHSSKSTMGPALSVGDWGRVFTKSQGP